MWQLSASNYCILCSNDSLGWIGTSNLTPKIVHSFSSSVAPLTTFGDYSDVWIYSQLRRILVCHVPASSYPVKKFSSSRMTSTVLTRGLGLTDESKIGEIGTSIFPSQVNGAVITHEWAGRQSCLVIGQLLPRYYGRVHSASNDRFPFTLLVSAQRMSLAGDWNG